MSKIRNKNKLLLIPDFPYYSNFVEINGINIHFIAEGNINLPTILFLHGVPTWSYTYRKILPICMQKGYRVIVPDMPGFGKSDKPLTKNAYSLEKLVDYFAEFIRCLELKRILIFGHDWGAIIGMVLATKIPEHLAGIIACNGLLPVIGQHTHIQFKIWKWIAKYSPILPPGRIVDLACNHKLLKIERAGYDFPFSNKKEKIAIRILPGLIPLKKEDTGANFVIEYWEKLKMLEKPFLTVFSDNDAITKGGEKIIQNHIPGAKNQPHQILKGKHFLQEDKPDELGRIITDFARKVL